MSEDFSKDLLRSVASWCRKNPGVKLHITNQQLMTVGVSTSDDFSGYAEREGLSYIAGSSRGLSGYYAWKAEEVLG